MTDDERFANRKVITSTWHSYGEGENIFKALCGEAKASDVSNVSHFATLDKKRVNCPDCLKLMEKKD